MRSFGAQALATRGPIGDRAGRYVLPLRQRARQAARLLAGPRRAHLLSPRRRARPKESFYVRSPTSSPDTLRESLALAYGVSGRVRKQRTLYLAGARAIHIDRVEGLGDFVELEVVLDDGEGVDDGMREAEDLMARLGVDASALVEGAYVDLLS
jgi:hypothetical protein